MSWYLSGGEFCMAGLRNITQLEISMKREYHSGKIGTRFHCEPAFVVARPKGNAIPVTASANGEAVNVEQRAYRAETEAAHPDLRQTASQQIHQERGNQRTVHDEAGITFHPGHIRAIVVNAMAVESQG